MSDHSAKRGWSAGSAPRRCAITVAGIGVTYSATRSPPPRSSSPSSRSIAQVAGEGLDPADAVLGDRRVDDLADLAVARLGDLADQLLLRRHHHARLAEARLERLEILGGREHVLVSGEEPRARRRLRHRALGAQLARGLRRERRRRCRADRSWSCGLHRGTGRSRLRVLLLLLGLAEHLRHRLQQLPADHAVALHQRTELPEREPVADEVGRRR